MTSDPDRNDLLRAALGLREAESPFPWQQRLLTRFLDGNVPTSLDIPTGLGKTAVMAVWLVARLLGARVPMRLVYVVDRRAVVDQATTVAMGLRDWVAADPARAARLGLRGGQLGISTLRGQFVDNREWLSDPAAPAIIVGTVDMIGSRMLFEGYGVSRKMRPFHAALLCCDALLVIDEAHLIPPFEHLARQIATRTAQTPHPVPGLQVLPLSATGRAPAIDPFRLDATDWESLEVTVRLRAPKRISLEQLERDQKLAPSIADAAWRLSGEGKLPRRLLVFCNKREDAEKVKKDLEERIKRMARKKGSRDFAAELLVGARRVYERAGAARWLEEHEYLGTAESDATAVTFLIATSAGEVGIDIDADAMVCDLTNWERMVQRLGRVNRRGQKESQITVVVEHIDEPVALEKAPEKRTDKEQEEVNAFQLHMAKLGVLRRLPPGGTTGCHDGSPAAVLELRDSANRDPELARLLADATSAEPLHPELALPLLEAWAMTSLQEHPGRPTVDPWLRGWVEEDPRTTLVWRTHILRVADAAPPLAELAAFFEAAPPHISEHLETETHRVKDWLKARVTHLLEEEKATPGDLQNLAAVSLDAAGTVTASWALADLSFQKRDRQLERALVGGTLVVDARIGGLESGLLSATADAVPTTADADSWRESPAAPPVVPFRVRVESDSPSLGEPHWQERRRFATRRSFDGEVTEWLVVDKWDTDAATEEDRSSAPVAQSLTDHHKWTARHIAEIADGLGLQEPFRSVLVAAALAHDQGKAVPRWQRAFRATGPNRPYAKTPGPIDYSLLDGYRHEFGSLPIAETDPRIAALSPDNRDLVLHLIAGHHGHARPTIPTGACDDAPPSALRKRAQAVATRFARLQKQWGPWGLAWWETLLRSADQQASAENGARKAPKEGTEA